jgi:biopolymer transport protein ExbD/biopolymer transport protein TolR
MFALVAMFLLPASIVMDSPGDARHAPVDLAKASHARDLNKAFREDALWVAVARDGKIWFGEGRVSLSDLPSAIDEGLRKGAEPKIYISADARAKYGSVLEVLERVRTARVEKIAFVVRQRESSPH